MNTNLLKFFAKKMYGVTKAAIKDPKNIVTSMVKNNFNVIEKTVRPQLIERSLKTGVSNAKRTFMSMGGPGKRPLGGKLIPQAVSKGKGILNKMSQGAVGMLNLSVLKGANHKNIGAFERYMQDGAMSKNILNTTRVGKSMAIAAGGIAAGMGTVGLANALSTNRHGRG